MTDPSPATTAYRLLRREAPLIAALLPGLLLLMANATLLNLPMREVTNGLDSDRYRVLWITCAYGVAYTFGCMMTGLFAGQFGLARTFWGALVVFGLFGFLSGLADTVPVMTPLRIVQGFAKGVGLCSSMVLLWKRFPGHIALWMGVYGTIAFAGALLGVPLGGLLVHALSWRWLFFVQLPLGTAAALVAALLLPDDRPAVRDRLRVDVIGVVLTLGWLICLIVVAGMGQYWGWLDSGQLILWLVGFVLFYLAFLVWGAVLTAPAVPTRTLGLPRYVLALIILDLYAVNLYAVLNLLSGFLLDQRGYQWWQGGAVLFPALPPMLLGVLAGAWASPRVSRKARLVLGMGAVVLATWGLSAVDLYTPGPGLAVGVALWGLAVGVATVPAMAGLFDVLTPDQVFQQTGVFNLNRFAPALVIGLLLGTLLARATDAQVDRLRLTIAPNRPAVSEALRHVEDDVHGRSGRTNGTPGQARAALGRWVRRNARAFALQTVLRYLALLTAVAAGLALLIPRARPFAPLGVAGASEAGGFVAPAPSPAAAAGPSTHAGATPAA